MSVPLRYVQNAHLSRDRSSLAKSLGSAVLSCLVCVYREIPQVGAFFSLPTEIKLWTAEISERRKPQYCLPKTCCSFISFPSTGQLRDNMAARFVPTIASQSLGRTGHHSLEDRLKACAKYGFEAIELFYEDLEGVAGALPSSHPPAPAGTSFSGSTTAQEQQLAAADYVHDLCTRHGLEILCLQPFMHYDGLLDLSEHRVRLRELHFWIMLAKRLHTDLIQIPSTFLPKSKCTGDRGRIIADLREVADIGLRCSPSIRFAYEALCWGTHVDRWDVAWDIVEAVDRPNFGTCLDTFNLAGRVYADPAAESGLTEDAHEATQQSIDKLRRKLDLSKVFYVEVCDGERLDAPIRPGHDWYVVDQPARMSWSRNARLFPFEEKGYLPALEILKAICDTGYVGHISFELFSRTANAADESVPEDHARRAQTSWRRLVEYMGWEPQKTPPSGEVTNAANLR